MSLTLEDVFYCHEYDNKFYLKRRNNNPIYPITIGINIIEKNIENYVLIQGKKQRTYYKKVLIPKSIYENLKIKHYIRIGEECPICYEGIYHKKDAQLTECGHAFHFSCLQNYSYLNKKLCVNCPICREPYTEIDKKRYSIFSDKLLDTLEDFWMNHKTSLPNVCFSFAENEKLHLKGTKYPKCHSCKLYCSIYNSG